MKKVLIIITLILITIIISRTEEVIIPKEAIRVRIIANSNSKKDQAIKTKIKEKLNKLFENSIQKIYSLKEAKENITNNISQYEQIIEEVYKENNYQEDYHINFGQNYFPSKVYKGITYQEGNYESLVITIGEGKGDNWWCILFPPLCLLENQDYEEVEYRFYVLETLQKHFE